MGLTDVTDVLTVGSLEPFGVYGTFKTAGAITRGYCVSLAAAGTITASATADLSSVIGVAAETAASGDLCKVLLLGYCDYIVTDGDVEETDLTLHAINGGTCSGATEAELAANVTLSAHVVGKNLLSADTATDTGYAWVCPSVLGGGNDT